MIITDALVTLICSSATISFTACGIILCFIDDVIIGTAGADLINDPAGNDTISGLDGADTITSGLGEDVVFGGAGDDLIGWSVTNSVVLAGLGTLPEVSDGRDVVDGGTEDTLGDTFTVNGNTSGERFWIYTREAFVNRNPTAVLAVATEIVITRNGRAEADVIAELAEIEEIVINTGGSDAGRADDVNIIGDFGTTNDFTLNAAAS